MPKLSSATPSTPESVCETHKISVTLLPCEKARAGDVVVVGGAVVGAEAASGSRSLSSFGTADVVAVDS